MEVEIATILGGLLAAVRERASSGRVGRPRMVVAGAIRAILYLLHVASKGLIVLLSAPLKSLLVGL